MPNNNLKELDSHFSFGDNWASYAKLVDDTAIESARDGILKLIPKEKIKGASFIDIGSGSGLHSLSALSLGASRLVALDIDPASVQTTRALLDKHIKNANIQTLEASIFDINPEEIGQFDIAYSWGVLHHTGDLKTAIEQAARLVKPNGLFVLALYRRTYLDWFWIREKRWYSRTSPKNQARAQKVYDAAFQLASALTGKRGTAGQRGMEYWHDLHDWLGGYPYEAIGAGELDQMLTQLGFIKERVFARGKSLGLFGSGCDEFVYRRKD